MLFIEYTFYHTFGLTWEQSTYNNWEKYNLIEHSSQFSSVNLQISGNLKEAGNCTKKLHINKVHAQPYYKCYFIKNIKFNPIIVINLYITNSQIAKKKKKI